MYRNAIITNNFMKFINQSRDDNFIKLITKFALNFK